jgi:hypothetical protein
MSTAKLEMPSLKARGKWSVGTSIDAPANMLQKFKHPGDVTFVYICIYSVLKIHDIFSGMSS